MSDYKLSASLQEHEDDVRGVVFPDQNLVLSASRDATVRIWKLQSQKPPKYDCTISSHGSTFINAITYLPPTKLYPEGLIISGGKDTIIEARQPGKPPEDNAEALLLGHAHNVCALDISPKDGYVVSGSWDGTGRVWSLGKWECEAVLEQHEGSVWAVLAYDSDTIITGCADKLIRIFTPSGKLLHKIPGSTDVVRALCRVPKDHPSEADFASAGNDGVIRLWKLHGRQVGELHGHENFIYSLVSSPSGELISSGEDRSVRVWRGQECVQTITHPAISVWGVAVCPSSGDIVSGASDRVVRVFSRDPDRQAAPEVLKAFDESVQSSSIPQQQVSNDSIKTEKPEFLEQKSGTKEGQTAFIQEPDGKISAHTWSQAAGRWVHVGYVSQEAGSTGKKAHHQGKDYDFVFDVDIGDDKPALKLPYNLSQNPYEAAMKFIQDNELPISYLDQTAQFITSNSRGATLGQPSQPEPAAADPWGSGRYVPGENQSTASPAPAPSTSSRPKVLPQTSYLSIKTANLRTIKKKIEELNEQLIAEGSKYLALEPSMLSTLSDMITPLEASLASNSAQSNPALDSGVEFILSIIARWPHSHVLPALDLLRLLTASTPAAATYRSPDGENIVDVLSASGVTADQDRPNNIMLATRAFSNLFETAAGRTLADNEFDRITELVKDAPANNRNLSIAVATLYVNYAVLFTSEPYKSMPSSTDRGLTLLDTTTTLTRTSTDSEAVYRALVALGTLLHLGDELKMAGNDVFDTEAALKKAETAVKEPRVKGVVAEIRALLEGAKGL